MNANVRDCLVTGYEYLIPTLELPDSADRHVLAAAIQCSAQMIVTFNLKDFPASVLEAYGIEAIHRFIIIILGLFLDSEILNWHFFKVEMALILITA
ncbi:hypothetical protein [Gloeothece verrucosa]|uniref:hypothetical protein n=1 Tax=Gloeothece verrucosa TaxID=2546359 RepID=UPI00017E1AE1|nr:hypothetical protein [Gloeothece verrucosa]